MPERVDEVNAAIREAIDVLTRFERGRYPNDPQDFVSCLQHNLKIHASATAWAYDGGDFEWEQPKHNAIAKAVFKDFGNYVQAFATQLTWTCAN